jgi:hypothetical protein
MFDADGVDTKRRPDHVTTTDFQSALSEDHHRPALRLALSNPHTNDSHELALQLNPSLIS